MNDVRFSGTVVGASELRTVESRRELLNFEVHVDGYKWKDPVVIVAYFPHGSGDLRKIENGRRVIVSGSLRHRRDYSRLFIAARRITFIDQPREKGSIAEACNSMKRASK